MGFVFLILKHHALRLICIITMFHAFLDVCFLCCKHVCWKDWNGLSPCCFYYCISNAHAFSCIHTLHSLYSYILTVLVLFCVSLSLPLSLVYISYVMALNCKSTPSRNPLRSGASTSFDPTPSPIRFSDDKAQQDFSENFSRRGVHSECQVILSDFSNTDLPTVIYNRGWKSLCDVLVICPFVLI